MLQKKSVRLKRSNFHEFLAIWIVLQLRSLILFCVFVSICQSSPHLTADFYQNSLLFVNKTRTMYKMDHDLYRQCGLLSVSECGDGLRK